MEASQGTRDDGILYMRQLSATLALALRADLDGDWEAAEEYYSALADERTAGIGHLWPATRLAQMKKIPPVRLQRANQPPR